MIYSMERSIEVLERTPEVLKALLSGLHEDWTQNNEGPDTFSPFDVVGHLIHGEKTDWRPRINRILEHGQEKAFDPYDRFAQYTESKGKTLAQLLDEFDALRSQNMEWFRSLSLNETDFEKKGMHPVLGNVTLRNLLATWVIHDLTHIAQIARVMAKQYKDEMGPWQQFFRIIHF
jgi:hypothetical protein